MPSSIQERFFEFLLAGVTYEEKDGIFYTACTTSLADVELMVEGCDLYPNGADEPPIDCTNEFEANKKFYWLQFSAQHMIIDTKLEESTE